MRTSVDLSGQRFGRLTVTAEFRKEQVLYPSGKRPVRLLKCLCDCGNITWATQSQLISQKKISCGCYRQETSAKMGQKSKKHGYRSHPLYERWKSTVKRTQNKNSQKYHAYGGRGIKLYPEWIDSPKGYIAYIESLPKPVDFDYKKYTIDRIDNDGNYEPGNLRWATQAEQIRNSRQAKITVEIAKQIKQLLIAGMRQYQIAKMLDVPDYIIRSIAQDKNWKDI